MKTVTPFAFKFHCNSDLMTWHCCKKQHFSVLFLLAVLRHHLREVLKDTEDAVSQLKMNRADTSGRTDHQVTIKGKCIFNFTQRKLFFPSESSPLPLAVYQHIPSTCTLLLAHKSRSRKYTLMPTYHSDAILKGLTCQRCRSIHSLTVVIRPPAGTVDVDMLGIKAQRLCFYHVCHISIQHPYTFRMKETMNRTNQLKILLWFVFSSLGKIGKTLD